MRVRRSRLYPKRHDGGDIQSRTEPQFQQGKITLVGPDVRHMATGQKNSTGFA